MCPEFNNEDIKEVSTNSELMPETETESFDDSAVPETDDGILDSSNKEAENTEDSVEELVENDEDNSDISDEELPDDNSENEDETLESVETDNDTSSNGGNYLLFGGKDIPEGINYFETLRFITEQLKYDGGELYQARKNKDGSGIINPEENATECCSYCGLPISGVDYYRLPDGRKRCTNCNRSLVKSLEELNSIFNDVLQNMELFFGATIDVPISVEMLEERKLKKKVRKGLGNPPKNVLILGVAVEHKGKYTIYIENGIPRASLIATLAHELTHIWQYTHWKAKSIKKNYGSKLRLVVYEGMAMWTEIQYLYHVGEQTIAARDELLTLARTDEYGVGFALYNDRYPLKKEAKAFVETPFSAGETPLSLDI